MTEAPNPARVAWILDTETTGQNDPQVIQFAYAEVVAEKGPTFKVMQTTLQMFRPTKPIELGAMATHHILPEDLEAFPPPPERFDLPMFVIGHHVDYDWSVLGRPDKVNRIDTLALAREAWPGLDSYKLGALIYHLLPAAEARALLKDAHNAVADLGLCYRVFLAAIERLAAPVASWGDVWRLSEHARIPKIMPFGKHQGAEIRNVPRDYVDWYRRQDETDPYLIKAFANAGLCPQPQENAA